MNRLFIKIKTDSKLKGTLLELNSGNSVKEVIDQIISNMEGIPRVDDSGQLLDYRLIRIGSPKRVLENSQSFLQENVKNSDVLLITTDPVGVMSQGLFDFEALTIDNQYTSVQDLRAPIRMLRKSASGNKNVAVKNQQVNAPVDKVLKASSSEPNSDDKKKPNDSPFEFQPLDIKLPEETIKKEDLSSRSRNSKTRRKI